MRCFSKVMVSYEPDEGSVYMYCVACDFFEFLGLDFVVDAVLEAESHHAEHEVSR